MRSLPFLLMATTYLAAQKPEVFTLKNKEGMEAKITNYGARVMSLRVKDKNGKFGDVVLGFDTAEEYISKPENPYFGAVVGRYGNRIAKGEFMIDGKAYKLAVNNGANALHGGVKGFDKVFWQGEKVQNTLTLRHTSNDMEEGYPGELKATVVYTLTDANELRINYTATTTKPTVVNLTNHTYFNLNGGDDILKHELKLNAGKFTPVDAGLIPTGELREVDGTPFDFRQPTAIGKRIEADDEQIKLGKGYDHNFVFFPDARAEVYEPLSGRVLTVTTDQPGVQFYTGNFLDGSIKGKGGKAYTKRMGFCLETQHFPDSPNKPDFPSTLLKPGQTYKSYTTFTFSTR